MIAFIGFCQTDTICIDKSKAIELHNYKVSYFECDSILKVTNQKLEYNEDKVFELVHLTDNQKEQLFICNSLKQQEEIKNKVKQKELNRSKMINKALGVALFLSLVANLVN